MYIFLALLASLEFPLSSCCPQSSSALKLSQYGRLGSVNLSGAAATAAAAGTSSTKAANGLRSSWRKVQLCCAAHALASGSQAVAGPGGACRVEAALRPWNKLLRLLLRLAGESSGASDEPERCVFSGSGVPDLVGSFYPSLVVVDLERFAYQHEMKSGWLVTTCLGGLVPLQGSSSSGGLELLAVLGASGSSKPDDGMAVGHLLQLDRSTITKYVDFDMLLKKATSNFVSSPGRRSASGSGFWSPVARRPGEDYKD